MVRSLAYWINLLGSWASIIAIVLVFKNDIDPQSIIAVCIISFLAMYLLFENIFLKGFSRKRYSQVIRHMNNGFSALNMLDRSVDSSPDRIKSSFSLFCTAISDAFEDLKKKECSVCIKIIYPNNFEDHDFSKMKVYTFCRDHRSMSRNNKYANQLIVSNNTDFAEIISSYRDGIFQKSYFFENNLPQLPGYKNSRIDGTYYNSIKTSIPIYDKYLRSKNWKLPYKSTIVVPIYPNSSDNFAKEKLMGFICIDSPQKNVFDKKYDIDLLSGAADTVYNYMHYVMDIMEIRESINT